MIPIPTLWTDLLHLFYPNLCLLCRRPLMAGEEHLCLHCLCDLPRLRFSSVVDNNRVKRLLAGQEQLHHTVAFLRYEKGGSVQQLVHAFKYYGNRKLAFYLGRQAALDLSRAGCLPEGVDWLIPVPLHAWRRWKRGYNQSEWIARGIQSVNGVPIHKHCVKRLHLTGTQTRKSVFERRLNMEQTFYVADPGAFAGQHLLLIDDVMTTGATIGACVDALCTIPDVRISILALSIV